MGCANGNARGRLDEALGTTSGPIWGIQVSTEVRAQAREAVTAPRSSTARRAGRVRPGFVMRAVKRVLCACVATTALVVTALAEEPPPDPCVFSSDSNREDSLAPRSLATPNAGPCEEQWRNTNLRLSQCWEHFNILERAGSGNFVPPNPPIGHPRESWGYASQLSLAPGYVVPDFPGRSADPVQSSSIMVPAEAGQRFGFAPVAERELHADTWDLVAGGPMIQHTDLTLPFGGAVFRHIRTYAERHKANPSLLWTAIGDTVPRGAGDFYDWQGYGWSMSSAPILLVNSALRDRGGDGKRRIYLVMDSNHQIPFTRVIPQDQTDIPNRVTYEAPAWSDASLKVNTWYEVDDSTDDMHGSVRVPTPKVVTVSLFGGSVMYEFKVYKEDLFRLREPTNSSSSYESIHRPFKSDTPADRVHIGAPYAAYMQRVWDRTGHEILIEYMDQSQSTWDDRSEGQEGYLPNCVRCLQNCVEKGQIKSIRLLRPATQQESATPGNNDVALQNVLRQRTQWLLLYTYRTFTPDPSRPRFFGVNSEASPPRLEPHNRVMAFNLLHSVHAYDMTKQSNRDQDTAGVFNRQSSTMPWEYLHDFVKSIIIPNGPGTIDASDILDLYEVVPLQRGGQGSGDDQPWHVPNQWTHEIRYTYSEAIERYRDGLTINVPNILDMASRGAVNRTGESGRIMKPRLIKTRVNTREATPETTSSVRVYRYGQTYTENHSSWMLGFYEPETVSRLMRDGRWVGANGQSTPIASSSQLVTRDLNENRLSLPKPDSPAERIELSLGAAADWKRHVGHLASGFYDLQSVKDIVRDIGLPRKSVFHLGHPIRLGAGGEGNSSDWTVLVTNDQSGKRRYVRIFHFLINSDPEFESQLTAVGDKACNWFRGNADPSGAARAIMPGTTILYLPYQWHESRAPNGSIVDEVFASGEYAPMFKTRWATVIDEYESYEAALPPPSGDSMPVGLPLSRRILHFNPRGHKIHEETWDMRTGAPVGSASSIIERHAYDDKGRVVAIFSPGHSRHEIDNQTVLKGHIRVFKYPQNNNGGGSINPIAEGVAEQLRFPPPEAGYADADVNWQRQLWYHAERHDLITDVVEFVRPPSGLLAQRPQESVWRDASAESDWIVVSRTDFELERPQTPPRPPNAYKDWYHALLPVAPKRVLAQSSASPIKWEGSTATLFAVTKEQFDDQGRSTWRGAGAVQGPKIRSSHGTGHDVRFSVSYSRYDELGREIARAEDTDHTKQLRHFAPPHPDHEVPEPPNGFARAGYGQPLHHLTTWKHGPYGPIEKIDPNTLGTAWRYTPLPGQDLEIGTYTRLTGSGAERVSIGPGTLMRMSGGSQPQAYTVEEVEWTGPIADPPNPAGPKNILRTVTPKYDKSGALAGAKIESSGTPTMEMSATSSEVNIGGMIRVVDVHGGITRTVSDRYGQPELIFRGTRDGSGHWRQSTEHQPDDMLLVEKRYYGTGPRDALLQVESRRYREKVQTIITGGSYPLPDESGMPTVTEYDIRRRPVGNVQYAGGTDRPPVGPTLGYHERHRRARTNTFYDHLDRPVFVAEY